MWFQLNKHYYKHDSKTCPFPAASNDKHSAESFQQIGRQKYGHAEMAQFLINIAQYPKKDLLILFSKCSCGNSLMPCQKMGSGWLGEGTLLRENTFWRTTRSWLWRALIKHLSKFKAESRFLDVSYSILHWHNLYFFLLLCKEQSKSAAIEQYSGQRKTQIRCWPKSFRKGSVNIQKNNKKSTNKIQPTWALLHLTCIANCDMYWTQIDKKSLKHFSNICLWTTCRSKPLFGSSTKPTGHWRKFAFFKFQLKVQPTVLSFERFTYMDVSKNRGTQKWMVYNGKPC